MNVYDFDGTILHGDSEQYFLHYIFKMFPKAQRLKRKFKKHSTLFQKGKISAEELYDYIYQKMLKFIDNLPDFLEQFWDEYERYIKRWYLEAHKDDDIIISATPRFILEPIVKRLKVSNLIATTYDLNTNKVVGRLCYKDQKVIRFKELFDENEIDNFYSDSDSDVYMAKIAKNAFKVKENEITPWSFE